MNKTRMGEVYDLVAINWNVPNVTTTQRRKNIQVWLRYFSDIDFEDAMRAVDARALAGGFPPRPAELRTDVLVRLGRVPPSPAQALVDSKSLADAVRHGTKLPSVHPLVSQTLADVGVQRDDVFQKLYDERRREALIAAMPTYHDGADMREDDDDPSN